LPKIGIGAVTPAVGLKAHFKVLSDEIDENEPHHSISRPQIYLVKICRKSLSGPWLEPFGHKLTSKIFFSLETHLPKHPAWELRLGGCSLIGLYLAIVITRMCITNILVSTRALDIVEE